MLCFSYVLGRNTSAGVWTLCAHRRLPLEFLLSRSGPRYLVIFSFWVPRTLVSNMSAGVLDSLVAHRRPRGLVSAFFGGLPDVWRLMFLSPWVFLGAYAFTFCGFGVVQSRYQCWHQSWSLRARATDSGFRNHWEPTVCESTMWESRTSDDRSWNNGAQEIL